MMNLAHTPEETHDPAFPLQPIRSNSLLTFLLTHCRWGACFCQPTLYNMIYIQQTNRNHVARHKRSNSAESEPGPGQYGHLVRYFMWSHDCILNHIKCAYKHILKILTPYATAIYHILFYNIISFHWREIDFFF